MFEFFTELLRAARDIFRASQKRPLPKPPPPKDGDKQVDAEIDDMIDRGEI